MPAALLAALALVLPSADEAPGSEELVGHIDGKPVHLDEVAEYTLDEWGRDDSGVAALEHLIQVALSEVEAERRGVRVLDEEVEAELEFLRASILQRSGGESSLADTLAAQGLTEARFRATLHQALVASRMIREDFGLDEDEEIPTDKQALWYSEKRLRHAVRTEELPPEAAAIVGPRTISRIEWGTTVFQSLGDKARETILNDLATIRRLQAAAKEEGVRITAADVDEELATRDRMLKQSLAEAGQSTQGVTYLKMLAANGQDPQHTLRSGKFRANILQRLLARHWYGKDGYRVFFQQHADEFESLWGRRAKVASIFFRAGKEATDEIPRNFADALEELQGMRRRLEDSDQASDPEEMQELFARLARIYSEHTTRERGGVLGALTAGQLELLGLPPELLEAEAGSLHGPVRVARGAHLVMSLGHQPERSFEQLEEAELEAQARQFVTRRVLDGIEVELAR